MTSKEQIFKMLEGRLETMQTMALESIELIYNAGYNEAIEEAAKLAEGNNTGTASANQIRSLKK